VSFGGGARLEIRDPDGAIQVLLTELGIQTKNVGLGSDERAAETVVLGRRGVVEHVHVDLAHETARASEIQLAFSTLSHVRNSPLPLNVFLIPMVYMGENAIPSRR
jgi:hypothetical protein